MNRLVVYMKSFELFMGGLLYWFFLLVFVEIPIYM